MNQLEQAESLARSAQLVARTRELIEAGVQSCSETQQQLGAVRGLLQRAHGALRMSVVLLWRSEGDPRTPRERTD